MDAGAKSVTDGPSAGTAGAGAGSTDTAGAPAQIEPTEDEIRAWAERERRRREAWLQGPTDEERAEFARRERERRLLEMEDDQAAMARATRRRRSYGRYTRETQLAAEGAMSLIWRWSRRSWPSSSEPAANGRRDRPSSARRRVPFDDEGH